MTHKAPPSSDTKNATKRRKKKYKKRTEIERTYDFSAGALEPASPVLAEQALWRSVVLQAIIDAMSQPNLQKMVYHHNDALQWLTHPNANFVDVCIMAGLDPSYVRKHAKRLIANPRKFRAEPGNGKRYLHDKKRRLQQSDSEPSTKTIKEEELV